MSNQNRYVDSDGVLHQPRLECSDGSYRVRCLLCGARTEWEPSPDALDPKVCPLRPPINLRLRHPVTGVSI